MTFQCLSLSGFANLVTLVSCLERSRESWMIDGLRVRLLGLPRRYKRILQVLADVALVWLSLWLAFLVRLGTEDMISPFEGHAWLFIAAPLVAIPLFIRFGMYRAVMRYLGNDALIAIAKAVTISALVLSLLVYWYRSPPAVVPRSLVFNYWWLSMLLIGGLRLAMRQYFMGDWYSAVQSVPFLNRQDGLPRVAIYGAGAAGNQLVAALRLGRAMRPVAFIDDDKQIANRVIAGLRVYTAKHIRQMIDETGAQEVLLAIPSATRARRREILESLEPFPLHVRSMPGFMDLASGRVKVDDLQEVDIADLLGRDSVAPRKELLERCIRGQVVMVTGAGGSIGSELCRQIMSCSPSVLILFEHSEYNLYSIHQELERRIKRESLSVNLLPILGSVRNPERLVDVMRTWKVNTVYHAAAYKHVPIVEHNIAEGVLNNVIGTLHAAGRGAGRRAELRADFHRQGGAADQCDGQHQAPGGDGPSGAQQRIGTGAVRRSEGRASRQQDPFHHGPLRQRPRFVRFGHSAVPRADQARRPGDGHPPEHHPLLHDHSRGGAVGHPGRFDGAGRRCIRAGHGAAGEDPGARREDDPPVRPERAFRAFAPW